MAKTINVYINGTDEPKNGSQWNTSLANVLHEMTDQTDQLSFCLDGCGVDNWDPRDLGAIFTFHLEAQVDNLIKEIRKQVAQEKVKLNLYGFSRGGAAVFWICQKLKDISPNDIEINVCSLEPVPGNFIRASYADNVLGFKSTLSGQIADLGDCENIKKMLVLFTNEPLPDILCHGPILPITHPQTDVTVDVLPGCHKNAELYSIFGETKLKAFSSYSAITFHYVTQFLESCGTAFNRDKFEYEDRLKPANLIGLLEVEKRKIRSENRSMHFYNEIQSKNEQPYLNLFHKELVTKQKSKDSRNCALSVKDPNPQPNYWNGQKSNGYFPMFAKGAAAATAFYFSPAAGVVVTGALVSHAAYQWYQQPSKNSQERKVKP